MGVKPNKGLVTSYMEPVSYLESIQDEELDQNPLPEIERMSPIHFDLNSNPNLTLNAEETINEIIGGMKQSPEEQQLRIGSDEFLAEFEESPNEGFDFGFLESSASMTQIGNAKELILDELYDEFTSYRVN